MAMGYLKRFQVVICEIGGNLKPAVIVSPDELNEILPHVLVAPVTNTRYVFPCRIDVYFAGKKGQIALDLMQPVLKEYVRQKAGALPQSGAQRVADVLHAYFAWD